MLPDYGYIFGAISSSILTRIKSIHGYANMNDHVKIRLPSASMAKSKNSTYASYCYDKWTNLSLNHEDNCIVLNIVLTLDPESPDGIGVRFKNDSSLF